MVQSVPVTVHIPSELWHSLQGEVNSLSTEEQTRLRSSPYPHAETEQYVLEEFLLRRRNLPEHLGKEIEVSEKGEVIIVSEGSLLG